MSFLQLILKNLFRQRVRTTLTVVGIAVGITTVVALGVIVDGLKSSMGEMLQTGESDFLVAQKGASDFTFSTVTDEEWAAVAARDDIAWVHGVLLHVVRVGSNPYFILVGTRPEDMQQDPPQLIEGRLLQPDDTTAIVIGETAARSHDLGLGDTLEVDHQPFTVVGITRSDVSFLDSGGSAPLGIVQLMAGKPGIVTLLFVNVAPGAAAEEVAAAIEAQSTQVTAVTSVDEVSDVDQGMQIMDALNLAISVLAVGIGAVGVMNTMVMSVFERTREIGILRAVGWSGKRILRMIVTESLLLCLLAAVAGLALGVLAVQGVMRIETISGLLQPEYSLDVVLRALLVAVGVALAGAAYPAVRAVRLTPMEALRHE